MEEGVPHKPMALAVWNIDVLADVPALGKSPPFQFINMVLNSVLSDRGLDKRKDANKKHVEAYVQVASKRYKPHGGFSKWGGEQITLSVLTVLPDFRRQGVATMMIRWGINAASEKGWVVTLCASPMGRLLYEHLKFVVIGTETIQVEDEEDSFSSAVMVLHPGT
jgi:GNAT superfamily N-acetyltransferase